MCLDNAGKSREKANVKLKEGLVLSWVLCAFPTTMMQQSAVPHLYSQRGPTGPVPKHHTPSTLTLPNTFLRLPAVSVLKDSARVSGTKRQSMLTM